MVPADSHKASPTPWYSGYCYQINAYAYGIITLYDSTFQKIQLPIYSHVAVLQPQLCRNIPGLGCFPFARHYSGNHYCFLFLRLLRCFSSAGCPYVPINWKGFPIRISADHFSLADPHSFSQLNTSFFVSESLGIPHTPLVT